ncbi:MAG: aldehyde dehydrogenase family protein [Myxococcales bacterium]|nr:aldehyde dehydrogenase family protein [Myxococcales bacterium]USN51714.1 MAG: aldehyde dehydrogenase family protein [Myxococcales bacterium]
MTTATFELMKTPAKEFALKEHGHFIGGEWCTSKEKTFEVYDPACARAFTKVSLAGKSEVDSAVLAARTAFESPEWAHMQSSSRAQIMWRIAELIEQHGDILAELESLDNGKPLSIARIADVNLAAAHFRYYAGWAGKFSGRVVDMSVPFQKKNLFHAYTEREAVGVVAQIIPWNFPLLMAAWKLAPALAAGCCVILKPAEQTPLSASYLATLLNQAGLPNGVVNIVNGDGTTGALLSAHNGVDKVAFTGSTEVGKLILQAAQSNLKKVSLELGGKSPNIIFDDCDLEQAIKGAAHGIFFNHGQCCCAGSRLFIHEKIYDRALEGISKIAQSIRLGPGMHKDTMMGPLVSKEQHERVTDYIKAGVAAGAQAVGGESNHDQGYFVAPTVLSKTHKDMSVVKEEIFGPVVCASPFGSEEEVIHEANDSIYGLAAGLWTKDISKAHQVSKKLRTGTVWVNCYNVFDANLPFGGYKQSGWGREMGAEALELYSETKSICIDLGKR